MRERRDWTFVNQFRIPAWQRQSLGARARPDHPTDIIGVLKTDTFSIAAMVSQRS